MIVRVTVFMVAVITTLSNFDAASARVIGCTTTGAAKYFTVLQHAQCEVVLVEEAAEILEAHVISSLHEKTEHLIMIGDHLQLVCFIPQRK